MITGYNTDVEYDGVVYHIQTEDKGRDTPVILSLVYSGGAILASKRSPYNDLLTGGLNEAILAERLNRQHKLICAAVHAGRIEDLKRMSDREPAEKKTRPRREAGLEGSTPGPVTTEGKATAPVLETVSSGELSQSRFPVSAVPEEEDSLQVILVDERELRGGEFVRLKVLVSRKSRDTREPVKEARVILKTLGSSFRTASMFSKTNNDGVARFALNLPAFKEGRAAILVRAEFDGETAELRRIFLPR